MYRRDEQPTANFPRLPPPKSVTMPASGFLHLCFYTVCILTQGPLTIQALGSPSESDSNGTVGDDATSQPSPSEEQIPIYIGGFFAFPGNPIFGALPYTVERAVEHVNNLTGILDGYELRIRWRLTNGRSNEALKLLNDLLYEGPPVLMTWGPILSRQALVVNEVAPLYNVVQVCLANSQALRDRQRYPLTVQMYWSEDSVNPARAAFVRYMGWRKVAIIFEDNEYFRTNAEDLRAQLEASSISVIATEAVSDTTKPDQQLLSLQRHDARIIFALSYFDTAIKLFCKIYGMNMFGAKYVWIIVGWYPERWWEAANSADCTAEELEEALQNHLSVPAWRSVDDVGEIHYGDIEPPEYQLEYIRGLLALEGVERLEHIESYDVLIAIAMALNRSIEKLAQLSPTRALHEFTYTDKEMASVLLESVYETRFVGPTGNVWIEDGGFRSEDNVRFFIAQFQDGELLEIIEYNNDSQTFREMEGKTFHWQGGSPPVDGETIVTQQVVISRAVQLTLYVLASVGIVLDFGFLLINIKYRKERAIKISTPPLNNLIVLGSLALYIAVFLFGVDESSSADDAIILLCHIKQSLICAGISLAFGALFMKTYRIHAIFSRAVAKLKRVDLPNYKLILGVFLFVAVDIVIFTVWIIFGKTYVDRIESQPLLDTSRPDREIYIVSVIPFCTSEYLTYFMGAVYITKGILLVFGIFLAWETRNISVSSLNDSRYIAMSIYIVAIFLVILLPMLNLDIVRLNATTNFAVLASAIIITNTTVLCLVFLPKIYLLYKSTGQTNFHISMMSKYLSNGSISTFGDSTDALSIRMQESLRKKEMQLGRLKHRLALLVTSLECKRETPADVKNQQNQASSQERRAR